MDTLRREFEATKARLVELKQGYTRRKEVMRQQIQSVNAEYEGLKKGLNANDVGRNVSAGADAVAVLCGAGDVLCCDVLFCVVLFCVGVCYHFGLIASFCVSLLPAFSQLALSVSSVS